MIMSGTELQVLVATKPVDFRKQADTLAAFVQEVLGANPFSGAVYVFRAKRIDRVKLLWWDGTGICLLTKRLEGAKFHWPDIEDGVLRLTPGQLAALLEGTEWSHLDHRHQPDPRRPLARADRRPDHRGRHPRSARAYSPPPRARRRDPARSKKQNAEAWQA